MLFPLFYIFSFYCAASTVTITSPYCGCMTEIHGSWILEVDAINTSVSSLLNVQYKDDIAHQIINKMVNSIWHPSQVSNEVVGIPVSAKFCFHRNSVIYEVPSPQLCEQVKTTNVPQSTLSSMLSTCKWLSSWGIT